MLARESVYYDYVYDVLHVRVCHLKKLHDVAYCYVTALVRLRCMKKCERHRKLKQQQHL